MGRMVRIRCKILTTTDNTVTVQTTDGGEVLVKFTGGSGISSTYVEIVGTVLDPTTVKKAAVIDFKQDLDMQAADKLIKYIHDPRFFTTIFS